MARELSDTVKIAVFSGTGNTFYVANHLAGYLKELGHAAWLLPMENAAPSGLKEGTLGIALPVACFSTYPIAWRFLHSLPEGNGRGAFIVTTAGLLSGGMEATVGALLRSKGYDTLASCTILMPTNYGEKEIPSERNRDIIKKAAEATKRFAVALSQGTASWRSGIPILSRATAALAQTRSPWRFFNKLYPLAVDAERCNGCRVCVDGCPERNIAIKGVSAEIGPNCVSCQRCVALCEQNAVFVRGKSTVRYRGPEWEAFASFLP